MGAYNCNCKVVVAVTIVVWILHLSVLAFVNKSDTTWLTLDGNAPFVIARGGFSGLFPDSSSYAYNLAMLTSVPDVILWCDVQLTKDQVGICFPDIKLDNSSNINYVYPKMENTYDVNGVTTRGYFPIDFTFKELEKVSLTQGIYSRNPGFDRSMMQILTVDNVFTQNKPQAFWLNIQHDAFYNQHSISMRSFVLSALKRVNISYISSPEVNFLNGIAKPLRSTKTELVFRFLVQDVVEPSTNITYGSLLNNLTFIKTFASGVLVPKAYIWPVDSTLYLLPHNSLVVDAHNIGLKVFATDFANDNIFAYNYSYNPVSEYLSFIDNGDFSVDGVLSDFPITPSQARECYAHLSKNASKQAKPLVISHNGASEDLPPCTDVSYKKAIADGADVIDCFVQMSKDGVPFCLRSINLMTSTRVIQTKFRDLIHTVNEIQPNLGIFSFDLNWTDIRDLTPLMPSPLQGYLMYRNPKFRTIGKLVSLSDFLELANNATSVSGVLIKIENAKFLSVNASHNIIDAVLETLNKTGYNNPLAKKVMIQSSNSSVLKAIKGKRYELVYQVDNTIIHDVLNATHVLDIKTFVDSVVISKGSVFQLSAGFLTNMTNVVSDLQSFKLLVYVQIFKNEFVTQAFDFYSDPLVEINSFVMEAGIDGIITEFPQTAALYKKNLCLKMKTTPSYMNPVQPGTLIPLMVPELNPTAMDQSELTTVNGVNLNSITPKALTPTSSNDQHQVTTIVLFSSLLWDSTGFVVLVVIVPLSCLAMIVVAFLL